MTWTSAGQDGSGNGIYARVLPAGMMPGVPLSEALHYIHTDHLGTPQVITDKDKNVVWSAVYEPFGAATVAQGSTLANHLRFPGQYFDAETGLHYNYQRDYSPELGRFLQTDLLGATAGSNLYAYAAGNPIRNFDPNGESPIDFNESVSGGVSGTIPIYRGFLGIGGGIGLTLQKCCDEENILRNELIGTARLGVSFSSHRAFYSSASGRGSFGIVRSGTYPACTSISESGNMWIPNTLDINLSRFTAHANLNESRIQVGYVPFGQGASVTYNLWSGSFSIMRSSPIGKCCGT